MPTFENLKKRFSDKKSSLREMFSSKGGRRERLRQFATGKSSSSERTTDNQTVETTTPGRRQSSSAVADQFAQMEYRQLNQLSYDIQALQGKDDIQRLSRRTEAEKAAIPVDIKQSVRIGETEVTRLGAKNIPLFKATTTLQSGEQQSVAIRIVDDQRVIDAKKQIAATDAGKHLAKQFACLPAEYSNGVVQNYLEVSEFCRQGDLKGHMNEKSGEERVASAGKYSQNLVEMMLDFKKQGASYTDIKPANFLINDEGRLVLSDTKSLILTGGERDVKTKGNIINTEGYRAPEQYLQRMEEKGLRSQGNAEALKASRRLEEETTNLDALERYQIGVTIYEMVTGHVVASEPRNEKGEHAFNFNHPALNQGGDGQLLKEVIQGLTATDPAQRMSFEEAQTKLNQLSLQVDHGVESTNSDDAKLSGEPEEVNLDSLMSDELKAKTTAQAEVVDLDEMMQTESKEEVIDLDKEVEEEQRSSFRPR